MYLFRLSRVVALIDWNGDALVPIQTHIECKLAIS